MIPHVSTFFVRHFGNSVLFGDRFHQAPVFFQPFMFYPDWFFMTWPQELFFAIVLPRGAHPYFATPDGPDVFVGGIFWFIVGLVLACTHLSKGYDSMLDPQTYPFPQRFTIANTVYELLYKLVIGLLFWHIVFARILSSFLTIGGKIGNDLSTGVERIVMTAFLAPPLICLAAGVIRIFFYLV